MPSTVGPEGSTGVVVVGAGGVAGPEPSTVEGPEPSTVEGAPALADPVAAGPPTATTLVPSDVPDAPTMLKLGTATWSAGQTEGTQEAVVDANGAVDGGADGVATGDGLEGDDAVPPVVGSAPGPSTGTLVPSPPPVLEPPDPFPLSTEGAEPIPLAPSSPAEGGVTLL